MTSASPTSTTGLAKFLTTHPSFQDPRASSSPLPALYADLSRQHRSNPSGYRASIEWWRDTLLDVTFRGVQFDRDPYPPAPEAEMDETKRGEGTQGVDRTIFRLEESTKARWTVDGVGRPLGLGTVISELEKDGSVVALDTFMRSSVPIHGPALVRRAKGGGGLRSYVPTPSGIASALLVTPARWAASQLLSFATGGGDDDDVEYSQDETLFRAKKGDWVCYELVHRISSAFLAQHFETEATLSSLSCLLSTAEFTQKLESVCKREFGFTPTERDTRIVLRHLSRDSGGTVTSQPGIVKIVSTQHSSVEPITEQDRSVVAVKETLRKVDLQTTSLEAQISHRTTQIKMALRNGQRSQAASYLRSRKALEQVLEKRMGVRETMLNVVLKIEQAQTDVEVIKAYRTSADVLKDVLGREELRVENVEKTMDGLQEALAAQKEVDDAIQGLDLGDEALDDEEMQQELDALEKEKLAEDAKAINDKESQDKQQQELMARLDNLRLGPTSSSFTPTQHQARPNSPKQAIAE